MNDFTPPPFVAVLQAPDDQWQEYLETLKPDDRNQLSEILEKTSARIQQRLCDLKELLSKPVEIPADDTENLLLDLWTKGYGKGGVKLKGKEAAQAREQFAKLKETWNN